MKPIFPLRMLFCLALLALYVIAAASEQPQIQTSLLDFVGGVVTDGGANTYVSADGTVRLINQFDLNKDGFLDLVFPSSHDNNLGVESFIYLGGKAGFRTNDLIRLPGDGAAGLALADLNKDGWPEVIIANEFNGTKTELHSFIYWGSARGFSACERTQLPTVAANAVAVGDLNRDGYNELVFASSGNSYQFSKAGSDYCFLRPASDIYWGSAAGYSPERVSQLTTYYARDVRVDDLNQDGHLDIVFAELGESGRDGGVRIYWGSRGENYSKKMQFIPGPGAAAVTTADLDQDGSLEILVANESAPKGSDTRVSGYPIHSYIYWGGNRQYEVEQRSELPTASARDVEVADLNDDGFADVVFANRIGGASFIYWGAAGARGALAAERRTALPTVHASRCAIADLNRDGRLDVVFANENDEQQNEVSSVVYWNGAEGFSAAQKTELPTLGALGVAVADLNGDGWMDVGFANARDGTAGQPVDSAIYWGNAEGTYTTAARQLLKGRALMAYASADLDVDGHVDLVLAGKELRIFKGSPQGFSPENSSELPVHYVFNARAADFNRDGYLDLSVSDWCGSPTEDQIVVYWGGPSGYSAGHRVRLGCPAVRTHTLADLDANGYLDILATSTDGHASIFWNGPKGFSAEKITRLPSRMAVAAEVADLNGDRFLDIILCNLFAPDKLMTPAKPAKITAPPQTSTFAADTYVYWGGPKGYSPKNRLDLPTLGSEDAAVADFNRDGHLDVVISSYHVGDRRDHPSYVYWGAASGLSPHRVSMLPTKSASGVSAADFNGDGWKDILFANHTDGTNHRTESYLYWGNAQGFSEEKRTPCPSVGVHFMSVADVGNIRDRADEYEFISRPLEQDTDAGARRLHWEAAVPFGSGVKFQVRFAGTREGLAKSPWFGPSGPESFFTASGSQLPAASRWLQYKAILVSPESANSPELKSVTIESGSR